MPSIMATCLTPKWIVFVPKFSFFCPNPFVCGSTWNLWWCQNSVGVGIYLKFRLLETIYQLILSPWFNFWYFTPLVPRSLFLAFKVRFERIEGKTIVFGFFLKPSLSSLIIKIYYYSKHAVFMIKIL